MAEKQDAPTIGQIGQWDSIEKDQVKNVADEYVSYFDDDADGSKRKGNYTTMVNHYYNLVTDFYEYGWGQSFHFARRTNKETFLESITSHEHTLFDKLDVKKGDKVLDCGCGVGGPMREAARHTGADIVGINNNDYQLSRLDMHNKKAGLDGQCKGVKGDFMKMPFEDNSFDGAYAIEATCHAPDKVAIYAEILRVLKPGQKFAMYEWCMTDKYDPTNEEHNKIKYGVEVGDSLPPMSTTKECVEDMKKAGFEVVFANDQVENGEGFTTWYDTLAGRYSLSGFRMTWLGRLLTHNMCRAMEFMRIAPEGTVAASQVLMDAADHLVAAGKTEIFTPMMLVVGQKPL